MRLSWKYLLTLLAASLVPLFVVNGISLKTSKKLMSVIQRHANEELVEYAKSKMVNTTRNYAMFIGQSKRSVELALIILAKDAEMALAKPNDKPVKIYTVDDFNNPAEAPEDLAPSGIHAAISAHGPSSPMPVSLGSPVFLTDIATERISALDYESRLSRLTPTVQRLYQKMDGNLYWTFICLDNGVSAFYPGHGGFAKGYDPRYREACTQAPDNGEIYWTVPTRDAATGRMILTASRKIFNQDGQPVGVVGFDLLISNALLKKNISIQWSDQIDTFLVGLDKHGPCTGLWVMSAHGTILVDTTRDGLPRTMPAETTGDRADFEELITRFHKEKRGIFETPYKGVESFWTYADIFESLSFVMVVPKSVAMTLPKKVDDLFQKFNQAQKFYLRIVVAVVVLLMTLVSIKAAKAVNKMTLLLINALKRLEKGDYSVRLDVRMGDERDMMVKAFNNIVPRLEEHMRMSRALGLAQEVQQSLLPKRDPDFPGFDVAGQSMYCEQTGGDYYDFFDLRRNGENRYVVVVGDVSGHGVSSALLMATARAMIMLRASMPGQAASVINDVNRHLSSDAADTYNFMTFFYLELYQEKKEACWVRAGHDPAIVYDSKNDSFDELKGGGPALGLDEDITYQQHRCRLFPGEIIMVGTDGIWEMHNNENEMFGKQRLQECIRANRDAPARQIVEAVFAELSKFRGERQPEDDVTMVVIKVLPA